MNLGSPESCRRFPPSPSEGDRAGLRGPPSPWRSGAQCASSCRGIFTPGHSHRPAAGPRSAGTLIHVSPVRPSSAWMSASVLLGLVFLGCSASPASAQPSMQTILTNGPTSNRLNVVVLSEGYTSSQLPQFFLDASNAVNVLLSHPPFQEYRAFP